MRRVQVPKEPVRRPIAPWGGLLFHRTVIERFGYPDPRFVLYSDDTEFTNRITSGGGEIWLAPDAEIEDIESGWVTGSHKMIYFVAWIERGSDEQVYYNLRNVSYLETHNRPHSWMRKINRTVLLSILWLIAIRSDKMPRFRLIVKAVKDGEAGRLGFLHSSTLAWERDATVQDCSYVTVLNNAGRSENDRQP